MKTISGTPYNTKLVLQALKRLEEKAFANSDSINGGICYSVYKYLRGTIDPNARKTILKFSFEGWPKHSGNSNYPIPCTNNLSGDAPCQFYQSFSARTLWQGEQGRLRRDLLDYAINKLEEELS